MNKLKKFIKNCPLAFCILCSWLIVATAEHVPLSAQETPPEETGSQAPEDPASAEEDEAALGGTMGDLEDGTGDVQPGDETVASTDQTGDTDETSGVQAGVATGMNDVQAGDGTGAENETGGNDGGATVADASDQKPEKIRPEYISYEKKKTDSPWYTDPGKIPLTTAYDYQKVKKDYFDDAVFIGDSRIVGMNDYSGLTNATFFAKTGLTVYNLLDDEFVKDPDSGKTVSVSYMMQHHTYGKIYLMVGINELGTGGTQRFKEAYKDVLKKFRKWQPDAVIYVQSIMGVSPKKDKTDPVFNNTNIRDKNYAISKLTDGIHIFYLNIQGIYEDENHNLEQDLTFDDVHLYAQHYDKWVRYLKTHAVVKGE